MKLFVAGLSYKTAPVELREKLAVHPSRLRCCGCRLKLGGNLDEVVLLSTCNRVEIYGVTPKVNGNVHRLFQHLSNGEVDFAPHLYVKEGAEAVQHLFSVASGLDSMVIGETEITGQVKQAYQAAQEAKLTGRVTNRLFQTALQAAKEIRTQTGIGRGATSVGSVAVELAERIFDQDLSQQDGDDHRRGQDGRSLRPPPGQERRALRARLQPLLRPGAEPGHRIWRARRPL